MKKNLIVIVGPTASGKTALAVSIAKKLGAEVVSADSRQVFREMLIGTARPKQNELGNISHHLLGHISIEDNYSAGQYSREARQIVEEGFSRLDSMIIVGGTGLYIKALLEGMDRLPVSDEIRNKVNAVMEAGGLPQILQLLSLAGIEPESLTENQNPQRMMRMLEWVMAGKPKTDWEPLPAHWRVLKIGIEIPREQLYQRINDRVEQMVSDGLLEEAKALFPKRELNALQTVGYKEFFDFFEGKYSQAEAIEKIKQHTRNYAKRQLTWFRKDPAIRWFSLENQAEMEAVVVAFSQGA